MAMPVVRELEDVLIVVEILQPLLNCAKRGCKV